LHDVGRRDRRNDGLRSPLRVEHTEQRPRRVFFSGEQSEHLAAWQWRPRRLGPEKRRRGRHVPVAAGEVKAEMVAADRPAPGISLVRRAEVGYGVIAWSGDPSALRRCPRAGWYIGGVVDHVLEILYQMRVG